MEEPQTGEMYEHFKGGIYEVVTVARDCESPERKVVIYKSMYGAKNFPIGTTWSRSLEDFVGFKEIDGKQVKRFTKIN